MFSNKIVSDEYSRSFAIIRNILTKKVVETLYITPDLRQLKGDTNSIKKDFEDVMETYASYSIKTGYLLKDKYSFEPVPNLNNKRTHREIYVMYGGTGSGKSYLVSKLFEKFLQAFPKDRGCKPHQGDSISKDSNDNKNKDAVGRNLIYISPNNVSNDESLSKLRADIKEVDIFKLNSPIDVYHEDFYNALVCMDDCDSNSFSYDLETLDSSLTPEVMAKMLLEEKTKISKTANAKVKMAIDFVNQSLKKFCWEARKNHTSLIYIFHDFFQNRVENMLLGEATKLIIFPYKLQKARFEKFCKEKLGLDKDQIKFIVDQKYYMYDYVVLDKQDKLFYMSPDTLKLL